MKMICLQEVDLTEIRKWHRDEWSHDNTLTLVYWEFPSLDCSFVSILPPLGEMFFMTELSPVFIKELPEWMVKNHNLIEKVAPQILKEKLPSPLTLGPTFIDMIIPQNCLKNLSRYLDALERAVGSAISISEQEAMTNLSMPTVNSQLPMERSNRLSGFRMSHMLNQKLRSGNTKALLDMESICWPCFYAPCIEFRKKMPELSLLHQVIKKLEAKYPFLLMNLFL